VCRRDRNERCWFTFCEIFNFAEDGKNSHVRGENKKKKQNFENPWGIIQGADRIIL
jgi:hypothetical protein